MNVDTIGCPMRQAILTGSDEISIFLKKKKKNFLRRYKSINFVVHSISSP
jgi:tRNA(His) 5'-end guanylyltransferase